MSTHVDCCCYLVGKKSFLKYPGGPRSIVKAKHFVFTSEVERRGTPSVQLSLVEGFMQKAPRREHHAGEIKWAVRQPESARSGGSFRTTLAGIGRE